MRRLALLSLVLLALAAAGALVLVPDDDAEAEASVYGGATVFVHDEFACGALGPIPDGNPVGVSIPIEVTVEGPIEDLNLRPDIFHSHIGDLVIELTSPQGTTITLMDRPGYPDKPAGCSGDNTTGILIDDWSTSGDEFDIANRSLEDACFDDGELPGNMAYKNRNFCGKCEYHAPNTLLETFDGESPTGIWTLTVKDVVPGQGFGAGLAVAKCLEVRTPCTDGQTCQLPVELTAFDAVARGADAVLTWATASETANAGFEVQRRDGRRSGIDAANPYETVAYVPGRGTATEATRYQQVVPALAPGTHTFRLKQLDLDGSFVYSPVVEVTVEVPSTHLLSAPYPNPFNPQAQFTLAVQRAQPVTVEVVDLAGRRVRLVHDGPLEAQQTHVFTLDAADLPSGTYLLRARGETFDDTRTLTLVK